MRRATDVGSGRVRASRAEAVAAATQAAVFVPVSLHRFVDGDEGVYAYASRLAVHGHVPYRDFFYEQTPLLPYVYGAWLWITGESWYGLRLLSVLLALVTGTLIFRLVRRRLGLIPAAGALALYTTSGLVTGYLTIVKTFPLAAALLFGAYVLVSDGGVRARRFGGAGVLLGLAIDTRLLVAAAVPVFLAVAVRAKTTRAFLTGLAAGLVPTVALLALDPRAFFFDTVRYHALKDAGYVGDLHEKAQTAATLVGLEPTDRALGVQFLLLLVLCVATTVLLPLRSRAAFPLAVAASVGAVSFLPTPTYVQYFAILVPFLVVAAAELSRLELARSALLVLGLALCGYAAAAAFAAHDFTLHDPVLRPSIESISQVSVRVQALSRPGERVLSAWPGYLFGTHANALSDYSNHFAPVAAAKISASSARDFHVVTERELERRIRTREVRVVVYRNWVTAPPFARWDAALAAGRYRLVATVQTARVYVR